MNEAIVGLMNTTTEKALADLGAQFANEGPGGVFAVLHVLHASFLAGKLSEFAKHCCAFPLVDGASMEIASPEVAKGKKQRPETLH